MKNEDEKLYPKLKKDAVDDKKLKKIIIQFINEMKKTSKFCKTFFEKYSIGGGGIEFLQDFEKLYNLLKDRILKEETMLYPGYKGIKRNELSESL